MQKIGFKISCDECGLYLYKVNIIINDIIITMKVVKTDLDFASSCHRFDIDSLNVGDNLVFNIYIWRENNRAVVIEAGTTLSKKIYDYLQKEESLYISILDEYKREFTCESLFTYIKYNYNDLKKSLDFLYSANNTLFTDFLNSRDDTINVDCLREIIKSIIFLVKNNPHYLRETIPLFSNEYSLAYHSLHVSIYAICLSHFLHFNDEELLRIGTAGMLINIGIKGVHDSIENKDSKLTLQEKEVIHRHTKYSGDIAKKNYIDDHMILDAIKHHHERHDASGYPDHLESKYISSFASILAICDVFDALTSDRPYRKKYSTFDALTLMMKEEFMKNKFDQKYLKVFLQSFLK